MSTLPRRLSALALAALLAAGCATPHSETPTLFDFGPLPAADTPGAAPLAALVVTDVTGPALLDGQVMYYRLNYADPLQARPYANSRWSSAPLQLLTQRIKTRLSQAGIKVLGVTDAAGGVPLLRIEADDFSHNFDSPGNNSAQVVLRASLFQGHRLLDQRTFARSTASSSADAAGGARALAAATDAAAQDILGWLATLPPRKE